jgi:argininosuccinate lyase
MASSKPSANMLWGGPFTGGLDSLMVIYNESIYFDRAIYAQEIRGGNTYARGNSDIGILTPDEFAAIEGSSRWKRRGKAANSKSSQAFKQPTNASLQNDQHWVRRKAVHRQES